MYQLDRRTPAVVALCGACLLLVFAQTALAAQPGTWVRQDYSQGPADNPLKGFVPFQGSFQNFPHSMEWQYIAWKDLQTGFDSFTWGPIDKMLDDIATRGHHAAFRVYADYPNRPYAVPDFLANVPRRSYTDFLNGTDATSYSPDYDNPALIKAMVATIIALGRRYDGDPRIGFITVGFIGFWGEWHTYRPDGCACNAWMPSKKTRSLILNTFDHAFRHTRLLLRYPDVGGTRKHIGFHDDAFADQTIDPPAWKFVGRLKRAGLTDRWRTQPIGGELFPPNQPCSFTPIPCNPAHQEFTTSVEATHASWIINHFAFAKGYSGSSYERAVAAARQLGYDLFVSSVRVREPDTPKHRLAIDITIQNRGVAPFYYDWPLQLGVGNDAGEVVAVYATKWKLTRVITKDLDVQFSHREKHHRLPPGRYTLLLRALNPIAGGKPLAFANVKWNHDVAGWLTLDTFHVGSGQ